MILILSIIPLVGICQPRSNGTDKYKVISQSQVITIQLDGVIVPMMRNGVGAMEFVLVNTEGIAKRLGG